MKTIGIWSTISMEESQLIEKPTLGGPYAARATSAAFLGACQALPPPFLAPVEKALDGFRFDLCDHGPLGRRLPEQTDPSLPWITGHLIELHENAGECLRNAAKGFTPPMFAIMREFSKENTLSWLEPLKTRIGRAVSNIDPAKPVLCHGRFSLGAMTGNNDMPSIVTGPDLWICAAESDLGYLVGELIEAALDGVLSGNERSANWRVLDVVAVLGAYRRPFELTLAFDFAAARIASHFVASARLTGHGLPERESTQLICHAASLIDLTESAAHCALKDVAA